MNIQHIDRNYFPLWVMDKDLTPQDREAVEGFAFFLSVAEKPGDKDAPYRHLARGWYEGLLTVDEGKRIRDEENEVEP